MTNVIDTHEHAVSAMKEADWINAFFQQSSSIMTLWNVYIVVALGIIGFVVQKGDLITPRDIKIITAAFFVFALSNAIPMYFSQQTLMTIYSHIDNQALFSPFQPWVLIVVHAIFDILIMGYLYKRPTQIVK